MPPEQKGAYYVQQPHPKWEVGFRKWEVGFRKWEVGMRNADFGSMKWEIGTSSRITAPDDGFAEKRERKLI